MSSTALAFLVSSALYTGFQWTVRVLVYPQFDAVPRAGFAAYEHRHQQRIAVAVGPLFCALGLSSIAVVVDPPAGTSRWWALPAPVLVAAVLAVTAWGAVPLHARLSAGFDRATYRRLLVLDSVRLACAGAATVVGVALALT